MEADRWYEEDSEILSGGKFIALEVSDHEGDYNSSEDDQIGQHAAIVKVKSTTVPYVAKTPEAGNASGNAANKRWSVLSNGSKKRWSSLSFASDERRTSPPNTTSSKKRCSTASDDKSRRAVGSDTHEQQTTKTSGTTNIGTTNIGTTNNGTTSSSSSRRLSVSSSMSTLHRSSTSNSLRQMFGKIVLQDEEKENVPAVKRFISKMSPIRGQPRGQPRSNLSPLDSNVYASLNNRKSYADNASIASGMSMSSAASNMSSASRWKFWKKNLDNSDANSTSNSSMQHQSYSNASLKSRRSQSSLKQKSSHSSLTKLGQHRNSVTSESISLPIPNQVSRDKLRTKLRNSTSVMSMNSTVISEEVDEFETSQLLKLCEQSHQIPLQELIPDWPNVNKLSKNVFCSENSVFKFLPLGQDELTHSKHIRIKELQLLKLFTSTPGLTQLVGSHLIVINGEPSLVCELKHAGVPLSKTKISSWAATLNIWWQCAFIIYAAETKFQFEHRDLQLKHILLDAKNNVTLCDYKLARASHGSVVHYTRLDHPLFFQGRGDYRYEVYNTMRHWGADSSSRFDPRNNLLWLHYLGVKLIEKQGDMPHDSHYSELLKMIAQVNPHRRKKAFFRRSDQILNCGDLLRLRK
ncbi:LANO_0F07624g1_1 [Lachancea nothofagi CBS 11611]|uniref:non-specific serine/threonine protein kinase n=1 Tax=Lachancea nothofagi CBS 11611 TaxID=1266666 RepID=A0A1G4K8Z7_9SACH|nr:LANO_0F07624g1_1 [Lachancea nothofagi CBS 11611]